MVFLVVRRRWLSMCSHDSSCFLCVVTPHPSLLPTGEGMFLFVVRLFGKLHLPHPRLLSYCRPPYNLLPQLLFNLLPKRPPSHLHLLLPRQLRSSCIYS